MKTSKILSNKWLKFGGLWLVAFVILFAVMLSDFFYYYNYLEVFPLELVIPLIIVFVLSLIVSLIIFFLPWPRLFVSKLLTVVALAFSMTNYDGRLNSISGFFRGLIPILPASDLPIISIFYFISLVVIAVAIGLLLDKFLKQKKREHFSSRISEFILVVIAVIGFWQLYHFLAIIPSIYKESNVTAPTLKSNTKHVSQTEKPDIYYIILDRYTSSSVLKSQFGYDNSAFLDELKNLGFTVNDNAKSNYPLTSISISSTMNADYTNNVVSEFKNNTIQTRSLYNNLIRQSAVAKALKASGYKYYLIGSDYNASNKSQLADSDLSYSQSIKIFGLTKRLRSFEVTEFLKSPFHQLFKIESSWWPFKSTEKDKVKFVGDQLDLLNSFANSKSSGGKFVFVHILVPHEPFVFNADGSISDYPGTDNYGKTVKTKYLDNLKYISNEIGKSVNNIIKNTNGQAVVLINADEGPYPHELNATTFNPAANLDFIDKTDMAAWPSDWLQMKFGILQAVHIPKASESDLQNLSSVNLFRIVLNNYLGYKLDYLPNCNFGFNRGDIYEYNYHDITKQLQGQPNPQCSKYQSLK